MSRTLEAIMAHMAPAKRNPMPVHANPLTANWQTGLEAGGYAQRKLRLAFRKVAVLQPA